MALDLVPLWTAILAFGVFMYVLLDGFDLGVGILFPLAHGPHERELMMNSIAPIWDFNETWLVLGGVGLFAAFPLAFAIVIPAVYFPILFMLVGLIFRGVAFEFSHLTHRARGFWSGSFFVGSLVATFAQGVVLGTYVQGLPVTGRAYSGGTFDWLTPFALLTGLGLVTGYGLLGSCWLVMKTEGELQEWARRMARTFAIGVAAFVAMVSLWTPMLQPQIRMRWFGGDHPLWLWPVPVITAALFVWLWRSIARGHFAPFVFALAIFLMGYIGLGISIFPMVVPYVYDLWQTAAPSRSQAFLMIGTLFLLPVILWYTLYSYYVFRGKVKAGTGYGAPHAADKEVAR
jgi:cytochrome d ubiquinol oxidase subunit II